MSNAANIVWEEDDEDQIIEYVRTHPCFYDTSSADYKNREIRSAEWDNLAKKFDVPGELIRLGRSPYFGFTQFLLI